MKTKGLDLRRSLRFPEAPWVLVLTPSGVWMQRRGAPTLEAAAPTHGSLGVADTSSLAEALVQAARNSEYDGRAVEVLYWGFGESVRFRHDLKTKEGVDAWAKKAKSEFASSPSAPPLEPQSFEWDSNQTKWPATLTIRPTQFEVNLVQVCRQADILIQRIQPVLMHQLRAAGERPGIDVVNLPDGCSVLSRSERGLEVAFAWPERCLEGMAPHAWHMLAEQLHVSLDVHARQWSEMSPAPMPLFGVKLSKEFVRTTILDLLDRLWPFRKRLAIASAGCLIVLLLLAAVSMRQQSNQKKSEIQHASYRQFAMKASTDALRVKQWNFIDAQFQPVSPLLAAVGEAMPDAIWLTSLRQTSVAPAALVLEGRTTSAEALRQWLADLPGQRWAARGTLTRLFPPYPPEDQALAFEVLVEPAEAGI
jgi:hypothetical protein